MKTARLSIRTTPQALAKVRDLYAERYAQHRLSFGDWVIYEILSSTCLQETIAELTEAKR